MIVFFQKFRINLLKCLVIFFCCNVHKVYLYVDVFKFVPTSISRVLHCRELFETVQIRLILEKFYIKK